MSKADIHKANQRTLKKTLLVVVAMFGFGYALVPMYNALCQALGVNGQTANVTAETLSKVGVDESRLVTVELNTMVNSRLPWAFKSEVQSIKVHPGKVTRVDYEIVNQSNDKIVGQAIHSVMPTEATTYFKTAQCFCYTQQTLKPNEKKKLAVVFMVDPRIPNDIKTLILSYNFLRADKFAGKNTTEVKKTGANL